MTQVAPDGSEAEGNTKPQPKRDTGKTKWVFTQNASKLKPSELIEILAPMARKFCFQLERGEGGEPGSEGYLHYQGMMILKKKDRLSGVKKWLPTAHLEGMKSEPDSLAYCQKEETRVEGPWQVGYPPVAPKRHLRPVPEKWNAKQQQVIDWVLSPPDERSILVWVDPDGGSGKTTIARELVKNHNAMLLGTETKNSLFAVGEGKFHCYIVNLSRSRGGSIPYEAIEMLKDGMFFSEKYESKMVVVDHMVHVIIFCNAMPDTSKMTSDRWHFVK